MRCAVLVDAGYLLGAAGTLLNKSADRSRLLVDYPELIAAIRSEAELQTGQGLLRILWYDGARDARPRQEHLALRVLPDVKVRLGDLVKRGDGWQQKGVDSYLQRDLTTLARNRAVGDVVLLGGDEDLRRSVEEAQDFGVRVHLWGVAAAAPEYNQSQALVAEADRRWVMPADWIQRFVTAKAETLDGLQAERKPGGVDLREPVKPVPSPSAEDEESAVEVIGMGLPSPEQLRRLQERFGSSETAKGESGESTEHETGEREAPRLRDLTSPEDAWNDNEADVSEPPSSPGSIGARYGSRWRQRADPSERSAMEAGRPKLPSRLDGDLLRYALHLGVDTWEDVAAKHAVRSGFWQGFDDVA